MVDFNFCLKPLFKQPIIQISSNLLTPNFKKHQHNAVQVKAELSQIIDHLGKLSAIAQNLVLPITSAKKLSQSTDQKLYLLADVNCGKNGVAIGLLKVGTKTLYLLDNTQNTRKIDEVPCILDFYVHETKQRTGYGKQLFETMLAQEKWMPKKCTIDRPSEKLMHFLKKHYRLERIIPQSNNFVLYEGFFEDDGDTTKSQPNENHNNKHWLRQSDALFTKNMSPTQIAQQSMVGRFATRRPNCSMGGIFHEEK